MTIEDLYNKETGEVIYPNIVTQNIPAGAITSSKIASGAVASGNIADGAITSSKINDEAITANKLSSSSVSSSKLQDSAVTSGKLAEGAVIEGKIVNGAVTRVKIGNKAVNIGKLNIYTDKWLSYLRATSINEFLQSVFQDYLQEVVSNSLIELQFYRYTGDDYSPVKVYYDIPSNEVDVFVLDDTGWNGFAINSSTEWTTAYNLLKDIYLTYLL